MESGNNKGLISTYTMVRVFLQQLFQDNLIDTDTYVYAMNRLQEEYGQKKDRKY